MRGLAREAALIGRHGAPPEPPRHFLDLDQFDSAELRGSGLLLGIRCVVPAADFVAKLRQNGLLCLTAGENVLRILPPLIVGESEIEEALAVMHKVAAEWPA